MAKLLQGYTKVLTPVNLLPNADFHMGGGVSNDNTVNTDRHIDFNKRILQRRCTFTNFTFTKSNGECRIQGYITATSQDSYKGCYIAIQTDEEASLIRSDGTLYTVAMRAKSNQPSGNKGKISFYASVSGTSSLLSVYYRNTEIATGDYKQSVMIVAEAQGGTLEPMYCICLEPPFEIGVPYYIDVTVKDLRLFEGAYVNPPAGRSIDRAETRFPMFVGMDLKFNSNLDSYGFPVQKIRQIYVDKQDYTSFQVLLTNAQLSTNGSRNVYYADLWQIPGWEYNSNTANRYFIKCFAIKYNNQIQNIVNSITPVEGWEMKHHSSDLDSSQPTLSIITDHRGGYSRFILRCVAPTGKHLPRYYYFIQPRLIVDNGVPNNSYPHYHNIPVSWNV